MKKTKPVIVCGDLNVAHKEIDLKNPTTNRKNAGFTDEEREKFTELLECWFYRYVSDIFIQILKGFIHGGHIDLMLEKIMQDGELIIL